MTPEFAIQVIREMLFTALILAAPMLLAGLISGLTISIFQSVTQIQEMTLTFIPKILAVVLVLLFSLPWMLNTILKFTNTMYGYISQMTH